jgi:hypothetical protein
MSLPTFLKGGERRMIWIIAMIPMAVSAAARVYEAVSDDPEEKRVARKVRDVADIASVVASVVVPVAKAPKAAKVALDAARALKSA